MKTTIVRDTVDRGRRMFLNGAVAVVTYTIIGLRVTAHAAGEVKDYLAERIGAVYRHDNTMRVRRSQDNPMIKKLYDEYLHTPVSERSEKLLHASYTDRSSTLKDG